MSKAIKNDEIYTASLIDKFFQWLKKTTYNNFLENNEKWVNKASLSLMYFIAAMSLITAIVMLLKYDALNTRHVLAAGFCGLLITLVLQYVAAKSLPCLNLMVHNTPVKLSSTSVLDIVALAAGILGIASLIGGLISAIASENFGLFIIGIGLFIICEYWLAMALKPEALNIEIVHDTSAGDEFIGLLTFFAKGSLKMIPLIFCGSMIFVAFDLVAMMFVKFTYIEEISNEVTTITYSLSTALLPLLGYIFFIGYYFTIDIARAILSIPEKLDKK